MKNIHRIADLLAGEHAPGSVDLRAPILAEICEGCEDGAKYQAAVQVCLDLIYRCAKSGYDASKAFEALVLANPEQHAQIAKRAQEIIKEHASPNEPATRHHIFMEGFILGHMEAMVYLESLDEQHQSSGLAMMNADLPKNLAVIIATSINFAPKEKGIPKLSESSSGRLQNLYPRFCKTHARVTAFFSELRRHQIAWSIYIKELRENPTTLRYEGERQFITSLALAAFKSHSINSQIDMLMTASPITETPA